MFKRCARTARDQDGAQREAQGWRGPVTKIDISGDWGATLVDVKTLADIGPWRLAVVLEIADQSARIGLQPTRDPGGFVQPGVCHARYTSSHGPGVSTITLHAYGYCGSKDIPVQLTIVP